LSAMPKLIPRFITNLFRRGGEPLPQPAVVDEEPEWKKRIRYINELVERHRQEQRLLQGARCVTLEPEERHGRQSIN
jgi:hypothetical protein